MMVHLCVLSRGVRDKGVHFPLKGMCCRVEVICPEFKGFVIFGVELVVRIWEPPFPNKFLAVDFDTAATFQNEAIVGGASADEQLHYLLSKTEAGL